MVLARIPVRILLRIIRRQPCALWYFSVFSLLPLGCSERLWHASTSTRKRMFRPRPYSVMVQVRGLLASAGLLQIILLRTLMTQKSRFVVGIKMTVFLLGRCGVGST